MQLRVSERLAARPERAVDDRPNQRFELGARQSPFVPNAVRPSRVDDEIGLVVVGQIQLRLDHRFADFLQCF